MMNENNKKSKLSIMISMFGIVFMLFIIIIVVLIEVITGGTNNTQSAGQNASTELNDGEPVENKLVSLLCENCTTDEYNTNDGVLSSDFYKKMSEVMHLYNSLELEKERIEDFDISLITATINYGKKMQAEIFQDFNQFGTGYDASKLTNKDAYFFPGETYIDIDNAQQFYKWSSIMLGTPYSLPDKNLRGLLGNLITGRVITECVKGGKSPEDQNDLIKNIIDIEKKFSGEIEKKTGLWDKILSIFGVSYTSDSKVIEKRVKEMFDKIKKGEKDDSDLDIYINLDYYKPDLQCSSGSYRKHTYTKIMNYEQYKVYLEKVYIPQTYINCDECLLKDISDEKKESEAYRIMREIFSIAETNRSYLNLSNLDYDELLFSDNENGAYGFSNLSSPLKGACTIQSYYGKRGEMFHNAIDTTLESKDKTLYAIADGVVEKVAKYTDETLEYDSALGYCPAPGNPSQAHPLSNGIELVIKHEVNGITYTSRYIHLDEVYVNVGDEVNKGEKVAKMGNKGCSTGTHLHFELTENGVNVNPMGLFSQCNGAEVIGKLKIRTTDDFVYPEKCMVGDLTLDEIIAGLIKKSSYNAVNSPEYVKSLAVVIRTKLMQETNWCNKSIPYSVSLDIENNSNDLMLYTYVIDTQGMVLNYSGKMLDYAEYSKFPCEKLPWDWQNPGVRSMVLKTLGIIDSPDLNTKYVNDKLEDYNRKCVDYDWSGEKVTVKLDTILKEINNKYKAIITVPKSVITSTSKNAQKHFSTLAARYYADKLGYNYTSILYEFYASKKKQGTDTLGEVDISTAPGLLKPKMTKLNTVVNESQGFSHGDILPGSSIVPSGNMSDEELARINAHLKDYVDKAEQIAIERGDLNPKRVRAMAAAYWLIYNPFYRVQYEFGGDLIWYPYDGVGWNPKWNAITGVECSNFVLWSLIQAGAPFRSETSMQHTHETLDNPTGVYLTVEQLLRSGVEPGDVLRKSDPDGSSGPLNGHWSIVMTVNYEQCFIEVAHAVNVQEDTKISRYVCGQPISYEHLHKMEVFYQDEAWKASVGK